MADASKSEQEPSIEEILSSIRQIISDDDDDAGAAAEEEVVIEPDPEPEEEEALDLTDRVDSEPEEEEPEADPEPEEEIIIDMQEPESEPEPLDDFLDDPEEDTPSVAFSASDEEDDSLLTKRAEDAAYGAFKKLAAKTAIDSMSGITIEEIVRDELRPMLREWLDHNLPIVVERILKEEMDKIARRAMDE
ncbi:MAG: PopZ family protein [Alphaproteobacteria bacterium]